MPPLSLCKRAALVAPLLFALFLLADDDAHGDDESHGGQHHLAVFTALRRHPPSRRVYRALLELTLLLGGTAAALYVWSATVGNHAVGILLFQPAETDNDHLRSGHSSAYRPLALSDSDDDDDDEGGEPSDQETPPQRVLSEEEAQDAYYDSDGEIPTPVHFHSTVGTAPQPPSVQVAFGAALDALLLILLSLFAFTLSSAEGGRYIEGMSGDSWVQIVSRISAPVFPLLLFLAALFHSIFPWKRRVGFWKIVSYTAGAPFYTVTFRDGFIGDIFTSTVRPMQDLAFTAFYILSGLRGWFTQSYSIDDAAMPLERSWLLHTTILPACMVSPLWWRFLQNLRQSYETKQRWPYLGNAAKYFVAAQVGMFGVFDPSKKESVVWLVCFVGATLYQIWWDVFMDWDLLHFRSSGMPQLRAMRLYPSKFIYWTILWVNCILRFGWTLSFLPTMYLDRSGILSKSFQGDFSSLIAPIVASAEIVRRTLWGLLRLEWEAIQKCREDKTVQAQLQRCSDVYDANSEIELQPFPQSKSHNDSSTVSPLLSSSSLSSTSLRFEVRSDMSARTDLEIIGELCLWATAFTSLGIIAAYHRETM